MIVAYLTAIVFALGNVSAVVATVVALIKPSARQHCRRVAAVGFRVLAVPWSLGVMGALAVAVSRSDWALLSAASRGAFLTALIPILSVLVTHRLVRPVHEDLDHGT